MKFSLHFFLSLGLLASVQSFPHGANESNDAVGFEKVEAPPSGGMRVRRRLKGSKSKKGSKGHSKSGTIICTSCSSLSYCCDAPLTSDCHRFLGSKGHSKKVHVSSKSHQHHVPPPVSSKSPPKPIHPPVSSKPHPKPVHSSKSVPTHVPPPSGKGKGYWPPPPPPGKGKGAFELLFWPVCSTTDV
jgi:hypothetical protein